MNAPAPAMVPSVSPSQAQANELPSALPMVNGPYDVPENHLRVASWLGQQGRLEADDLARVMSFQRTGNTGFFEALRALELADEADIRSALGLTRGPVDDSRPAAGAMPSLIQRPPAEAPAAGSLPNWPIVTAPQSARAEEIRAIRTGLMLAQGSRPDVFAVVSPGRAEGRTRMSTELALALAQLGQPTLLVDADLQSPALHRVFGLGAETRDGLAQALTGQPARIVAVGGNPNLHLLPAGGTPGNALELLSGPALWELLTQWRRRYRHIIFDTPAAGLYSDALAVAAQAGCVLPVVRQAHARTDDWREVLRRLEATRARLLGAVLQRF